MRPTLYQLSQPSKLFYPHSNDELGGILFRPASVAEWLRRQTQVLVLFEGVSSNLTGCNLQCELLFCFCFFCLFVCWFCLYFVCCCWDLAHIGLWPLHIRRLAARYSAGITIGGAFVARQSPNKMSLSIGLCLHMYSTGRIAQSVERWSNKPLVKGSSPFVTR